MQEIFYGKKRERSYVVSRLNCLRADETHAFVAFYEIASVVKVELFA